MALTVDIEKRLGQFTLRAAFEVGDETAGLLGASGSGKSMTLRCIAGMETPDRGRIVLDGKTLFDSEARVDLRPQARRTGLMFQNYALFPHMTVLQNIRAGAKREKDRDKREETIRRTMADLGLSQFGGRYPSQLSGGQQQRVALARMLVSDPDILMLDEPFSALDSHLRLQMERELMEIIRGFGRTAIFVSHDRDEVFRVAERIVIMDNGTVAAQGPKHQVFDHPETRAAAILTGCRNVSPIRRLEPGRIEAEDWGMTLRVEELPEGRDHVGVRARDILPGEGENAVRCRVMGELEDTGCFSVLLTPAEKPGKTPLIWEVEKSRWEVLRAEEITVHIPPERILLLKGGEV